MKLALALPYCPWIPERVACYDRLINKLGDSVLDVELKKFGDKLPNDLWSEQVFEWLSSTDSDWSVQLQEDALVPEGFKDILEAILSSLPTCADIVGLQSPHPLAPALAKDSVRMFTTSDMLIGVGWCMRTSVMQEFVRWRGTKLRVGWRAPVHPSKLPSITEDTMIALFAMDTGRRIYHPLPTIVDHDTSLPSVWGNDSHPNRKSTVTWHGHDLEDMKHVEWWQTGDVPHLGRFYESTPSLAYRWVDGFDLGKYDSAVADKGVMGPVGKCAFCSARDAKAVSVTTGAGICVSCLREALNQIMVGL